MWILLWGNAPIFCLGLVILLSYIIRFDISVFTRSHKTLVNRSLIHIFFSAEGRQYCNSIFWLPLSPPSSRSIIQNGSVSSSSTMHQNFNNIIIPFASKELFLYYCAWLENICHATSDFYLLTPSHKKFLQSLSVIKRPKVLLKD